MIKPPLALPIHLILCNVAMFGYGAARPTASAFSFGTNDGPAGINLCDKVLISRRSFLTVTGASTFGVAASPLISNADTKQEANGKYIILNSAQKGSYDDDAQLKPMDVVDRITEQWYQLESKYSQNGLVDYISIGNDSGFEKLQKEMAKLQHIKLNDMNTSTKMAFVINLYNALIRVAFVTAGIPKNDLTRLTFFDTAAVNVGGDTFTFNDLENGILRANSVPPYHLTKPFGRGDPRESLALLKVDPRIHFALNCGAKSCPAVKRYSVVGLDDELRNSALEFCMGNVLVDEGKREVRLSKIFKWYMSDFASSKSDIPNQVLKYLTGKKRDSLEQLLQEGNVAIDFIDYDWTTNDSTSKTFG